LQLGVWSKEGDTCEVVVPNAPQFSTSLLRWSLVHLLIICIFLQGAETTVIRGKKWALKIARGECFLNYHFKENLCFLRELQLKPKHEVRKLQVDSVVDVVSI